MKAAGSELPSCAWVFWCEREATNVVVKGVPSGESLTWKVCTEHRDVATSVGYEVLTGAPIGRAGR